MIPASDPLVRLHVGPDLLRGEGLALWLLLFPARRLMRPSELGMLVLAGLTLELRLRWPWGRRDAWARISYGDCYGWRSPIDLFIRSDIDEIAARLAAARGWPIYGRLG